MSDTQPQSHAPAPDADGAQSTTTNAALKRSFSQLELGYDIDETRPSSSLSSSHPSGSSSVCSPSRQNNTNRSASNPSSRSRPSETKGHERQDRSKRPRSASFDRSRGSSSSVSLAELAGPSSASNSNTNPNTENSGTAIDTWEPPSSSNVPPGMALQGSVARHATLEENLTYLRAGPPAPSSSRSSPPRRAFVHRHPARRPPHFYHELSPPYSRSHAEARQASPPGHEDVITISDSEDDAPPRQRRAIDYLIPPEPDSRSTLLGAASRSEESTANAAPTTSGSATAQDSTYALLPPVTSLFPENMVGDENAIVADDSHNLIDLSSDGSEDGASAGPSHPLTVSSVQSGTDTPAGSSAPSTGRRFSLPYPPLDPTYAPPPPWYISFPDPGPTEPSGSSSDAARPPAPSAEESSSHAPPAPFDGFPSAWNPPAALAAIERGHGFHAPWDDNQPSMSSNLRHRGSDGGSSVATAGSTGSPPPPPQRTYPTMRRPAIPLNIRPGNLVSPADWGDSSRRSVRPPSDSLGSRRSPDSPARSTSMSLMDVDATPPNLDPASAGWRASSPFLSWGPRPSASTPSLNRAQTERTSSPVETPGLVAYVDRARRTSSPQVITTFDPSSPALSPRRRAIGSGASARASTTNVSTATRHAQLLAETTRILREDRREAEALLHSAPMLPFPPPPPPPPPPMASLAPTLATYSPSVPPAPSAAQEFWTSIRRQRDNPRLRDGERISQLVREDIQARLGSQLSASQERLREMVEELETLEGRDSTRAASGSSAGTGAGTSAGSTGNPYELEDTEPEAAMDRPTALASIRRILAGSLGTPEARAEATASASTNTNTNAPANAGGTRASGAVPHEATTVENAATGTRAARVADSIGSTVRFNEWRLDRGSDPVRPRDAQENSSRETMGASSSSLSAARHSVPESEREWSVPFYVSPESSDDDDLVEIAQDRSRTPSWATVAEPSAHAADSHSSGSSNASFATARSSQSLSMPGPSTSGTAPTAPAVSSPLRQVFPRIPSPATNTTRGNNTGGFLRRSTERSPPAIRLIVPAPPAPSDAPEDNDPHQLSTSLLDMRSQLQQLIFSQSTSSMTQRAASRAVTALDELRASLRVDERVASRTDAASASRSSSGPSGPSSAARAAGSPSTNYIDLTVENAPPPAPVLRAAEPEREAEPMSYSEYIRRVTEARTPEERRLALASYRAPPASAQLNVPAPAPAQPRRFDTRDDRLRVLDEELRRAAEPQLRELEAQYYRDDPTFGATRSWARSEAFNRPSPSDDRWARIRRERRELETLLRESPSLHQRVDAPRRRNDSTWTSFYDSDFDYTPPRRIHDRLGSPPPPPRRTEAAETAPVSAPSSSGARVTVESPRVVTFSLDPPDFIPRPANLESRLSTASRLPELIPRSADMEAWLSTASRHDAAERRSTPLVTARETDNQRGRVETRMDIDVDALPDLASAIDSRRNRQGEASQQQSNSATPDAGASGVASASQESNAPTSASNVPASGRGRSINLEAYRAGPFRATLARTVANNRRRAELEASRGTDRVDSPWRRFESSRTNAQNTSQAPAGAGAVGSSLPSADSQDHSSGWLRHFGFGDAGSSGSSSRARPMPHVPTDEDMEDIAETIRILEGADDDTANLTSSRSSPARNRRYQERVQRIVSQQQRLLEESRRTESSYLELQDRITRENQISDRLLRESQRRRATRAINPRYTSATFSPIRRDGNPMAALFDDWHPQVIPLHDAEGNVLHHQQMMHFLSAGNRLGRGGTSQSVIDNLPNGTYSEWATPDSEKRCPICFEDYEPQEPVLRLPSCAHWFHRPCLVQWLRNSRTCPMCRAPVQQGSSSTQERSTSREQFRVRMTTGGRRPRQPPVPLRREAQANPPSNSASGTDAPLAGARRSLQERGRLNVDIAGLQSGNATESDNNGGEANANPEALREGQAADASRTRYMDLNLGWEFDAWPEDYDEEDRWL